MDMIIRELEPSLKVFGLEILVDDPPSQGFFVKFDGGRRRTHALFRIAPFETENGTRYRIIGGVYKGPSFERSEKGVWPYGSLSANRHELKRVFFGKVIPTVLPRGYDVLKTA